ncbi:MAG: leucine-rich repeat domain-containing protein [Ruminococcaceae bacterium]|nr:leucine-rich repeat domain-containing protein [Oscillospiraceae bacterium]
MKNTTVFEAMSMVRDSLISESLTLFEAQAPTSRTQQPNAFSRFINSGWGVAVICFLVGVSVMTGILWAVSNTSTVTPAGTDAPKGSEKISELWATEAPSEIPTEEMTRPYDPTEYTEGLVMSVINIGDQTIAEVIAYLGEKSDVIIPTEYRGYPVTTIGSGAFDRDNKKCDIISVFIPESVTTISNSAFKNCTALKELHLPESVSLIEEYAFWGCGNLETITVDESNTYYHANGNCLIETTTGKLILGCKNSVIPDDGSVKILGFGAFYNCYELTEITIPENVVAMEDQCFYQCYNLSHVQIDAPLTSLGERAFYACNLTEIDLPDTLTTLSQFVFDECENLTHVTIPSSVTKIHSNAFNECMRLAEITIPSSVTYIGHEAFSYSGLEIARVEADVISLQNAFETCEVLKILYLPETLEKIDINEFYHCGNLSTIYFGGTCAQWEKIGGMDHYTAADRISVICSDGELTFVSDPIESQ